MKDEIKEILDLLNFNRDTISNGTCRVEDFISREQIIKLLDYITNLQKEKYKIIHTSIVQKKQLTNKLNKLNNKYNDLQEENEMYSQLKDEYEDIIEKAIEYINKLSNEPNVFGHYGIDYNCKKYLLNILQGVGKDE